MRAWWDRPGWLLQSFYYDDSRASALSSVHRSSLFEVLERLVLECECARAVKLGLFVAGTAYFEFFPAGAGARTPRMAGWDKH